MEFVQSFLRRHFAERALSGDVKCLQFTQASYCVDHYLANHTGNGFVKKHTEKLFSVYTHSIVAPGKVGKGNYGGGRAAEAFNR